MTLDLIFLPLLGGYLFFSLFNGTRYRASSFPAQRIIFPSAAYGLAFLILARSLAMGAEYFERHREESLNHAVGIAIPAAALSVLVSIVLGVYIFGRRLELTHSPLAHASITGRIRAVATESFKAKGIRMILQLLVSVFGCMFLMRAAFDASPFRLGEWVVSVTVYALVILAICAVVAEALKRYAFQQIGVTLFRASAVILILTCAVAVMAVRCTEAKEFWAAFSPVADSGTPIISVLLATAAFWLGNRVLTPLGASAFHFVTQRMHHLQCLFYESALDKVLIQINLVDNKVYVGWVRSLPAAIEAADGFFLFLPLKSGFRNKDTRELSLPTDYALVLQQLVQESKDDDDLTDKLELYFKVVRTSTVTTAGRFNPADFKKFTEGARVTPKVADEGSTNVKSKRVSPKAKQARRSRAALSNPGN